MVDSEEQVTGGNSFVGLDQYSMFAEIAASTLMSQQSVSLFGRFLTVARGTEQ